MDLISAVTPRLGPTMRIGFEWNATSRAQRRIDSDDHIQVHGPGHGQPPDVRTPGPAARTVTSGIGRSAAEAGAPI
ncbi:hypothetical protein [Nocardia spumae]|uniref:hypothetical protein n=1 Tax=Nocardia spumae TaxID=2887190 RepID=UPI001D15A65A|nr:hypothetical protein [Nocardia spumae]